jgi:TPR repeat protein
LTGDDVHGETEAMYWYQRAVSKDDHPRANFRLALVFVSGIENHLEPDVEKAIEHFRRAAKQNDQDAMVELGQLLLTVDDTYAMFPPDLQQEGIHWYEIAADRGCRDAQRELGNLYHTGRDEEEQEGGYPIFPVVQDFEKAYDYFSFAAHLGDKTSALFLGTYYEHGIDIPPNIELAQHWYTIAIEIEKADLPLHHPSGWWPAQLCLARVLYQNEETQNEAYKLFQTVFSHKPEQHLAYLEYMIAMYELKGLGGVPVQSEKAAASLLVLAEQGFLKAFLPVAECYESGLGVAKDESKALQWYVLLIHNPVADQDTLDEDDLRDLAHAYYRLAEFYRKGTVVAVDLEKSETLYRIAAERGKMMQRF